MKNRTLHLRKDVLAELAQDELEAVAGAEAVTIMSVCYGICPSWPVISCLIKCLPPTA